MFQNCKPPIRLLIWYIEWNIDRTQISLAPFGSEESPEDGTASFLVVSVFYPKSQSSLLNSRAAWLIISQSTSRFPGCLGYRNNSTNSKMPKKKTGARKKAEKQKERQRGIRAGRDRPITEYFCNVSMVSTCTILH